MKKDENFDLKEFQSKVLRTYKTLTKALEAASASIEDLYQKQLKKSNAGFIKRILIKAFCQFNKKFSTWAYVEHPNSKKLKREADDILENAEVKKILSSLFKRKILPDFYKEELEFEVIKIITTVLTKQELSVKCSIDIKADLFSRITYRILQEEINNYCDFNRP